MIMEKKFIRAKSQENKNIRIQQIMDTTDKLFYEKTYHEITLTMIAKEIASQYVNFGWLRNKMNSAFSDNRLLIDFGLVEY